MDDTTIARALHILGVIHWIGGLAFVTVVILPLARAAARAEDGLDLFERIERRFAAQVRISVPLVGATGFWMTWRLDLWSRFAEPEAWWMWAMVAVWTVFMVLLFVVEPLVEARLVQDARRDAAPFLARLLLMHRILLAAALVAGFGAVAGAHGLFA